MFPQRPLYLAVVGCLACSFANAADLTHEEIETANVLLTAPVVVTATRVEQNSFDLPMSIDSISGETLREGQLQVNLSETASRVPGVVVNNRNNPAQDLAVQIRGFGARSAFGVRGVRLYADGIPLTMPDGQGQTGTFNLDTAKSVEFLRGPFSALYGNSSGGVVQIFTQDGPADPTLSGGVTFGSYNTRRGNLSFGNDSGDVNYIFNAATYRTDGYRDHSEARRDTFNGKVKVKVNENTALTIVGTALDQPDNDDPQGLTLAELKSTRKIASASALTYDTRVSRSHEQVGASLDHKLSDNDSIRLTGYYGQRDNEQYLSTTIAAQTSGVNGDRNGGGVSTIDRTFGGLDLRWMHKGLIGERAYNITAGVSYDEMDDARKGYENFSSGAGNTCGAGGRICGVKGNLRRDEDQSLYSFDQYLQASMDVHPRWTVNGGVRHSKVHFDVKDNYFDGSPLKVVNFGGSNIDDSGSKTYSETTPALGVVFKLNDSINLYANAGRSFETPTFVEISYSPTGDGPNFGLKPAKSRQYEIGAKAFIGTSSLLNVSLFKINTDNEIVVQSQSAGRTVYQNVPKTERTGMELSLDSRLGYGLNLYLAYTLLDAKFSAPFQACNLPTVTPNVCNAGDLETIASGSEIPGTYRYNLFGELSWKHAPTGFSTALEVRKNSKTYINYDLKDGSAEGYTVWSLRGGFNQTVSNWKFSEFVRVENLFDQEYAGAVRVADINQRFYESAPTRNWLLGLNASYQF